MTRGRRSNTVHLIAANLDQAREQWIAVFARDRADLGPAQAAALAAAEAARYAQPRFSCQGPSTPRVEQASSGDESVAWTVAGQSAVTHSSGVRRPEPSLDRAPREPSIRR